ncbi:MULTISPECIES: dihydroorotate dehydrogenase [unclassified Oceanispirochaeta]|uniref:dihydroorotate dehydrogenase n=1 Tax=unclassified Oceanispirochaeta TaxID=2635722 RepID=UPI000E09A59C|nr:MULTISPECIES: dihydroorotate dehydrogenase [unclassified Oceanispirochaeta]MBF9017083.1 dihydroorotate dehydrogenase [Oceanispirochaeta sp. M2]NPD73532.1 dihydroorotate dehydrogenase [Oceanispirochaeta sp. M1]RDG30820.1 dihydroorotate dehydrogenase [Oceanispirochaeta sp. M1]
MDLSIKIKNKTLPNPVGVASGTFGYGEEYAPLTDLSKLGAIYTKAVTVEPRPGNPLPRLVETPAGMINSIGLANVGTKGFLEEKIPFLKTLSCPVILNVAGSLEEDYAEVIRRVDFQDAIWGYEVNISCPNVKHGGLAFGTDPVQVERLTSTLRKLTDKPLIMKLTPNVTDITAIARAAEAGGADAVACINTVMGMVVDIHKRKPAIPAGTGGLSGPAIKPVGIAAVYRVSKAVNIPVIGLGGIMNADDAVEYLLAGASALQIGTANFIDPDTSGKVLAGIKKYMREAGFTKISDFHGYF